MDANGTLDILVVDDDPGHLVTLKTIMKSWGYQVEAADDGSVAVEKVRERSFDIILMDVRMTMMDGIEALKRIKAYNPAIPILIMTAYSSVESAVEALKTGAYDYLTKPLDFEVLKMCIERAREHIGLKEENIALREKLRSDDWAVRIIGKSKPIRELIEMIAMIAPTDATVLITGQSGTGKELIARSIHMNSLRSEKPFITVNCAALTETLLESELFGHEKGAFTGADKKRKGLFSQADTGTIFLDEIGEMSINMQVRLLRVLQEGEIQRVGGEENIKVDVRVLAATNRELMKEVEAGNFREDLFYRLNVVSLNAPSLKDRIDDVPLLANHFMRKYAKKNRKPVKGFSPLAMDMLLKHDWPGNVRELENAVERSVILLQGDYITEKQLPLSITEPFSSKTAEETKEQTTPKLPEQEETVLNGIRSLEEIEKEAILAALEASGGNKSKTARELGITRKTLHMKLKKYGKV